jgi:hypothetical protein
MQHQQPTNGATAAALASRASRRADLAVSIEAVRARVRAGSYHPPPDDVAEHLVAWLFSDHIDDDSAVA